MTTTKRPAHRPALPLGEKMEVVSIRLTPAMREKLRRVGQQALRQWLAAHPE